jgi:hypothetical protein
MGSMQLQYGLLLPLARFAQFQFKQSSRSASGRAPGRGRYFG